MGMGIHTLHVPHRVDSLMAQYRSNNNLLPNALLSIMNQRQLTITSTKKEVTVYIVNHQEGPIDLLRKCLGSH